MFWLGVLSGIVAGRKLKLMTSQLRTASTSILHVCCRDVEIDHVVRWTDSLQRCFLLLRRSGRSYAPGNPNKHLPALVFPRKRKKKADYVMERCRALPHFPSLGGILFRWSMILFNVTVHAQFPLFIFDIFYIYIYIYVRTESSSQSSSTSPDAPCSCQPRRSTTTSL